LGREFVASQRTGQPTMIAHFPTPPSHGVPRCPDHAARVETSDCFHNGRCYRRERRNGAVEPPGRWERWSATGPAGLCRVFIGRFFEDSAEHEGDPAAGTETAQRSQLPGPGRITCRRG
jgi:hypothetical protein